MRKKCMKEPKKQQQKSKFGTYSDGGRQQPASIGVSFANLNFLRVCIQQVKTSSSIENKETEENYNWYQRREMSNQNKFRCESYTSLIGYCNHLISQDSLLSASSYGYCSTKTRRITNINKCVTKLKLTPYNNVNF